MIYVPKIKIPDTPIIDTSTFEKIEGEYLRDAWYRIKELHTAETNPCSEPRLHINFYFGSRS
jgi:hypothetical protein